MTFSRSSPTWMIKPRRFVSLLGAEYELMKESGDHILVRFYLASILIILIVMITTAGIFYAIELLFHNWLAELSLSLFFALLFVIIYIFLVNTFAKEGRPSGTKIFNLSNSIRIVFVIFIGAIVAETTSLYIFESTLDKECSVYKTAVIERHQQQLLAYFKPEFKLLQERFAFCSDQRLRYHTSQFDEELTVIQERQVRLQEQLQQLRVRAVIDIERSSFFLYRIEKVNQFWMTRLLVLIGMVLFVLPGYLVFSISHDARYFRLKKQYECSLIDRSYENYEQRYVQLFAEQWNARVKIFSRYEDPPYNKRRKEMLPADSMESFIRVHVLDKLTNS